MARVLLATEDLLVTKQVNAFFTFVTWRGTPSPAIDKHG
jgi:hypothetical protein